MRTKALTALALVAVTTLAGCGFIFGSGVTWEASPAPVAGDALSGTGYEEVSVSTQNVSHTFSAAGQSRNVTVVNQMARYEKSVSIGPIESARAAVFVSYSSPAVELFGTSFNPISGLNESQLLERSGSQYAGLQIDEKVGTRNVTALGDSRSVSRFTGQGQIAGQSVDVYVSAAKFQHGSDIIMAVAIYPQSMDGESETVETLLSGLQHESD
jgi:hypothetical protein